MVAFAGSANVTSPPGAGLFSLGWYGGCILLTLEPYLECPGATPLSRSINLAAGALRIRTFEVSRPRGGRGRAIGFESTFAFLNWAFWDFEVSEGVAGEACGPGDALCQLPFE